MNLMNSKSERSNTGYKGITYRKQKGRKPVFESKLALWGKDKKLNRTIWIGQFKTVDEAITAREKFIKSLF